MAYQSFVGLEIHIQLLSQSKIFCACRSAFGDEPNTNICPICMGYPGTLPILNRDAIHKAYVVAKALNCTLSDTAVFDRKNYFYPDLPKNYQISQFGNPVGTDGFVDLEFRKVRKRVRIHDVHLEEDPAKMIHAGDITLVDFNRAGTPLLEIVTEPDLEIGAEAEAFLQGFRRIVRYLGVCDGNMEEGSLRCDANISVNLQGQGLGRKVEVKNMNSSRFVRKAIDHEIQRQEEIITRGGTITMETRLWNENRDVTESMRSKETAMDYRYFPDPDLPPFRPDQAFLDSVASGLVELPLPRRERMVDQYDLSETQADFICDEKATADFFEETIDLGAEPRATAAWLGSDVKKMLNREGIDLQSSPLTPNRLAGLLRLLADGRIHGKIAKQVLAAVFEEDEDPEKIIADRGLEQITDSKEIERVVTEVLANHSHVAQSIKEGDRKPFGFLVGQVMKITGGRAEPGLVNEILNQKLASGRVFVLVMGGAMSGTSENGIVYPGDVETLKTHLDDAEIEDVIFEDVSEGSMLSEEITPEDWAHLVAAVGAKIESEEASSIVITHGTDTLAYTASLVYWLFSDVKIPIILTASLSTDTEEISANISDALAMARAGSAGVYVVLNGETYSPVNLKFERVADSGFRNWNMDTPIHSGPALVPSDFPFDFETLHHSIERATKLSYISQVFPGMRADSLTALMNAGAQFIVMELYDTGTANLRESPFGLRDAFRHAREHEARFFCTSQQEGIVDFSGYATSHELWKDGAIPMGALTTESAYTRLLVTLMMSTDSDEVAKVMEEADADISG